MRRAQQRRLREQQAERSACLAEMRAEVVDDALVDEVMTKYRRSRPTPVPTPAPGGDDVRREIDALMVAKNVNHEHGMSPRVDRGDPCRAPLTAASDETV